MKLSFTFLFASMASISAHQIFTSKTEANQPLSRNSRSPKNTFAEEHTKRSSLERECIEESCNLEEFTEAAENVVSRSSLFTNIENPGNLFQKYYTDCMDFMKSSEMRRIGVDSSDGFREVDGQNWRLLCMKQWIEELFVGRDEEIQKFEDEYLFILGDWPNVNV